MHLRGRRATEWPAISIVLSVYNESEGIATTLERILATEYPRERRQILVLSDGSTDGTDEIVAQLASRGVELLRFAWMLWSHKVCRWLAPWTLLPAVAALAALAPRRWWAAATLALCAGAALVTAIGWLWPAGRRLPRLIALPAYAVVGNIAALQAWMRALGRQGTALWEPTRRGTTSHPAGRASRRASGA